MTTTLIGTPDPEPERSGYEKMRDALRAASGSRARDKIAEQMPSWERAHPAKRLGRYPVAPRPVLAELVWAPYQEFGVPDSAQETYEPPEFPVMVRATGYRGGPGGVPEVITVYWEKP
jgi:hypothetical protein